MGLLRNLRQGEGQRGPWERRVLFWAVGAIILAVISITAAYYFDQATESDAFCGLLCHPNRPEYVTHEVSPHANVECGTCHIGPGLWPKVKAKIFGVGELVSLITNTYHRPIELPVERMRPASVICQQCHWPLPGDENQVHMIPMFAPDESNAESRLDLTTRISEIGGAEGHESEEHRHGAHWHVENPVEFIALDELDQEIAWVSVTEEGRQVEYLDQGVRLTPEQIARLPHEEISCLNCHNRATHIFRKPERVLDEALATGHVDSTLPYVKREGARLLSTSYPTQEAGVEAMTELSDFYATQYPGVYASKQDAIEQAVGELQQIYQETVFPSMNLSWEDYPNNLGHADFPGCFRCHDGEHLNAEGQPIPANCTLCHSVPVVTEPDEEPDAALAFTYVGQIISEPASHREPTFVLDHRILADQSCAECHGPIEYGTDNSSFCANGICHGREWLEPSVGAAFVHPVELVGQHAQAPCSGCHQGAQEIQIENCADCHQPPSTPHFGSDCSQCHTPQGWEQLKAAFTAGVPTSPHPVDPQMDCIACHGQGQVEPMPASHQGFPSDICLNCHQADVTLSIPTIPHPVGDPSTCMNCHGEGQLQPTSELHRGISADLCLFCHKGAPLTDVPVIPHVVEGRSLCLTCHGEGGLVPVPPNHEGWTNDFCLLCHEPS